MQVDISPLIQSAIGLGAIAVSIFGSIALQAAARRFHAQTSAAQLAAFDAALDKALSFGVTQADDLIRTKGWDHPDVKNAVLATALTYVTARLPDALNAVGLSSDLNDPKNRAVITDALTRALPSAFTAAAASPATPAAPATPTPILSNH